MTLRMQGGIYMSEKEKQILETFGRVIPELSEAKKEFLLGFGEGLAFKAREEKEHAKELNKMYMR